MNVWDLLKHDHREVEQIFAQLAKEEDKSNQEKLFGKLKHELELHTKVEETHFYPALKNHDETRDMVEEALEEHGEVKKMLTRLSSLATGGDAWRDGIKELQGSVEHHVEEEENEVFPAARKVLDERQAEEMGRKIEQEKQAAKAG